MKIFKTLSVVLLLVILVGCSPKEKEVVIPTDTERTAQVAIPQVAVFVKGITYATSWGEIIVTNGVDTYATGYIGATPKLYGDWIYFINYVKWYYPTQTQPAKLNYKTGQLVNLGALSTIYNNDQWMSMDVADNGTYAFGKYSSFKVYNAICGLIRSI